MRTVVAFSTALFVFAVMAFAASPLPAQEASQGMMGKGEMMMGGMMADAPVVPPVTGYSEGEKVLFLHTEASDPGIAKILTDMMGSPVLVVPALAQAPKEMLARVYVFTNGLKGEGPLGPLRPTCSKTRHINPGTARFGRLSW